MSEERPVWILTPEEMYDTAMIVHVSPAVTDKKALDVEDDSFEDEEVERLTARRLRDLIARDRAQELYRANRRGRVTIPTLTSLKEILEEPDEEQRYRIQGWWPIKSRVMLSAAQKTGKTTLTGNLTRSLADGVPFLGYFEVEPLTGNVAVIDNEMSPTMLRRWYRDIGIETPTA
ncbi:AAA family ATPase [Haloechinothrix salitolerans]|uniref:AAA family ATPase n=1 Tax=Haloechinothrix salitolerans TaxID=926830 RepID=A0ABW2C7S8_9PSEU